MGGCRKKPNFFEQKEGFEKTPMMPYNIVGGGNFTQGSPRENKVTIEA
jgi:hypothetical protein